jgi:hypothetical protein
LHAGGIGDVVVGAGDDSAACFQRLAQSLQRAALELRKRSPMTAGRG